MLFSLAAAGPIFQKKVKSKKRRRRRGWTATLGKSGKA
jgi:hypothetical protein